MLQSLSVLVSELIEVREPYLHAPNACLYPAKASVGTPVISFSTPLLRTHNYELVTLVRQFLLPEQASNSP